MSAPSRNHSRSPSSSPSPSPSPSHSPAPVRSRNRRHGHTPHPTRPGSPAGRPLAPALALLTTERPRPARIRDWPAGWWLGVATVCFGAFMGQLDASITTLIYPALQGGFHAGLALVSWVSLAYLLALVALLVPIGRLSDAHGRKLMYLHGFVLFAVASAACGLAPSLGALIAFRAVQAVGAALLQANSVALVTSSARLSEGEGRGARGGAQRGTQRGTLRAALGVQAGAQALGLALGPTVGAVIVSTLGWRWVFFVNVPVAAVAVVAGHYLLPRTRTRVAVDRFDWPGLGLLVAASTTLMLGISAVSGLDIPTPATAALFLAAALSGLALARRLRRAANPLIAPAVLRAPGVLAGLTGALGGYLVLFGPLVLVPVALTGAGVGLAAAGLCLTALPAGFALAALAGNKLLPSSWSDRRRALIGSLLAVAALLALMLIRLDGPLLVPVLAALGLGLGVYTPANNTLVMAAIPANAAGTGGGLVSLARGLGTAFGVCVVTLSLHAAGTDTVLGGRIAAGALALVALGVLATALLAADPATRQGPAQTAGP